MPSGTPSPSESRGQPFGSTCTQDRKSTRLNSSHSQISYAVFCLKKKKEIHKPGEGLVLISFNLPQLKPLNISCEKYGALAYDDVHNDKCFRAESQDLV